MSELFGVSAKDAEFISQGRVRRTLGAGTDLLRSAFWELAIAGSAQSPFPLTSEQISDMSDGRQHARRDIVQRVQLRRLARSLPREPVSGRTKRRIALGAVSAAGAAIVGLTVPATVNDLNAARQHYQTAFTNEQTIADNLSPQAGIILDSQLKPVEKSLTSPWTDSEAGQQLGTVLGEEITVLGEGAKSWRPVTATQGEISAGNNAQTNSVVNGLAGVVSGFGVAVAGGIEVASILERRRRRY